MSLFRPNTIVLDAASLSGSTVYQCTASVPLVPPIKVFV